MTSFIKMFLYTVWFMGCVTARETSEDKPEKPPEIDASWTVEEAVNVATRFGGDTLQKLKNRFQTRREWRKVEALTAEILKNKNEQLNQNRLINTAHLYQSSNPKQPEIIFSNLVKSSKSLAKEVGWQIASTLPSGPMAKAIDAELTRAVSQNDDQSVLLPQMAVAVQMNQLKSAYTLVREGLFSIGHESFATAMASLNPKAASKDLLDYLALAPVEELRQLTLTSVNLYSVMVALNHFMTYPPEVTHPKIDVMFLYVISRNTAVAEMANSVMDHYLRKHYANMAQILSRFPAWIQIAYIENARRNMSSSKKVFLSELKKMSSQTEVIEEINEIKL